VKCSRGLRLMIEAGVDPGRVTFTSDGQGSLPLFDAAGRVRALDVGRVTSLFAEVRAAVQEEGLPLETALRVITENPARLLKLRGKGTVAPGADADLVLLDPVSLDIRDVMAKGTWLMTDGVPQRRGTFE